MPAANLRLMSLAVAVLCAPCLLLSEVAAQESYAPRPITAPASLRPVSDASASSATTPGSFAGQNHSGGAHPERPTSFQPPNGTSATNDWPAERNKPVQRKTTSKKLPNKKSSDTLALRPTGDDAEKPTHSPSSGLGTMFASLCLVLGLFFLAIWMIKKAAPKGARVLPNEAVEVLGRVPLGAKQNAHLLRVGNKMLLVAISAGGAETLTEIADPLEVDRLAGICQQALPSSSTNAFKQIFQQFAQRGETEIEDDPLPADTSSLSREARHA